MMLNRIACGKCKYHSESLDMRFVVDDKPFYCRTKWDCDFNGNMQVSYKSDCPEGCPYATEHIVTDKKTARLSCRGFGSGPMFLIRKSFWVGLVYIVMGFASLWITCFACVDNGFVFALLLLFFFVAFFWIIGVLYLVTLVRVAFT